MLIENLELRKNVINVASVPHRSPFRYPGGKTWFVPTLRRWLMSMETKPVNFIEPFAGGSIAGLTVAFENLAEKVVLVELDEDVASVWQTILSKDNSKLAKKIVDFDLTRKSVDAILSRNPGTTFDRAFQTILRNRVNHAGIMAPGAGLVKNGEAGRGLSSRWYPETLAKRIIDIQSVKSKIIFKHESAFDVIPSYIDKSSNAIFVDPPYTASGKRAGARLYRHYQLDHNELFNLFAKSKADFLFTYDDNPEVRDLSNKTKFKSTLMAMKNSHHAKMTELLIGKDLSWLQST